MMVKMAQEMYFCLFCSFKESYWNKISFSIENKEQVCWIHKVHYMRAKK